MLMIQTDNRGRHVVTEIRPDETTRVFGKYRTRDAADRRMAQVMESRGDISRRGSLPYRGKVAGTGGWKWTGRRWKVKRAA